MALSLIGWWWFSNQPTPNGVGQGGGLYENQGLAADTSQLGVSGSGSILASNSRGFGESGPRWLAQLKPYPLGGGSEDMTLADLGNIGEAIGAVAVVVSLVYVASQIRQNTKAVRAAAVHSSIGYSMDVRRALYESDALTRIYITGSNDPKALSEEDLLRLRLLYHNLLLSLWNIYSQTHLTGLPAETWIAQIPLLQRVLSSHGGKWFWASYSHEFEPSFQEEVARVARTSSTDD